MKRHLQGFLSNAPKIGFLDKQGLINLQNQIVDPRYKNLDYRTSQVYVGQTLASRNEKVHFVGTRPEEVGELMDGLINLHWCEGSEHTHTPSAVVVAAVVAYGFVFIHPFDDGNGRIHRFLIHQVLSHLGFTPPAWYCRFQRRCSKTPDATTNPLKHFPSL